MRLCSVRRLPAFLVLLASFGAVGWAGAADILEPRVVAKKTFSESYTLIADLDGGVYLQLQLVVSNLGVSNRRGGCRLLLVERGESTWTDSSEVSSSQWSYQAGARPVLRVGECSLQGGERTELRVAFDRGVVTLVLDAAIHPVRPLDRTTRIGSDFYESEILGPWAPARATVEDRRGGVRILQGRGYADHSRSTTLPLDLARRWVRFRGLAASGSVLLLARFPGDGGEVDGWLWLQGQAAPVALASVRVMRLAGESGGWRVRAQSVSGSSYEIVTGREIHRHAPVEEQGLLGRLLRRLLGNPVTYTYRAALTRLSEGTEPIALQGIAEVTLVDE